jgi:hypothetical protein
MSSPAPEVTPGLAAVRSWCGWHVGPSVTETIRVESGGGRVLLLPSLHVTDVTAIRDESGNEVTGYKWRDNGIVRGHWRCEELYEIDLTHGYETMPSELLGIVDRLDAEGGDRVLTSVTRGPFSESYGSTDLEAQPITTRAIIGRYRLPSRP